MIVRRRLSGRLASTQRAKPEQANAEYGEARRFRDICRLKLNRRHIGSPAGILAEYPRRVHASVYRILAERRPAAKAA